MASQGRALALFAILLLLPISSFSLAFPHGPSALQNTALPLTNNTNGTTTIPLSVPPIPSSSLPLGQVNPSTTVTLGVVLPSKDPFGLSQYIDEISSPLSKQYHEFLSQQQYSELYGPSATEALSLGYFFSSNGLSVSQDKYNPDLMFVSGTAGATEKALRVSIQSFRVGSTTFYSATSGLELPSEFSNIQTVFGLTDYVSSPNVTATPMYKILGPLNSTGTTTGNTVYYSPSELRQIYNASSLLNAGYTGSGVTIAIVDAYGDPYIQQEINNFSSAFGLPGTTINQICVDGPCDYFSGITAGWNTEIALDVEWAHAMAPEAKINLYIGSNASFPLFDAVQKAVSDGGNSIISMSWGSPENSFGQSPPVAPVFGENYPWLDQVLQQAAAEGITVFASSGDWGAYDQSQGETSTYGGAIYPSTDPYVTAVGGTSLYMNVTSGYLQYPYANASGTYGSETAWSWSDFANGATGGGYSSLFPVPAWQSGPGFSGSSRGAPDVSWDADPQTGVIVSISNGAAGGFTYYIVGGTSVGSPSWAGSLALIDQKAGGKLGLINPKLYSILNDPAEYQKAFHDVTIGNNNPNSAGVGWDPLTGIGSPNLGELAGLLAPTGSLGVSVSNQLSGSLTQSFSYGTTVKLSANVTGSSSPVSSAAVQANILGPSGQKIATNVPFSYSPSTRVWTGTYTIKPGDPPGMWTADVFAQSGSLSGEGFSTFSVGDGITLFLPYYNVTTQSSAPVFLLAGEKLNVSAQITYASGQCCVSSGSFAAFFTLGSPAGKLEGKTSLSYNATSKAWQGQFPIPSSADQGSWILTVNGTDSSGNSGSTYSWLNVGLNVLLTTDSPSYITGDTVTVFAAPLYPDGLITPLGVFNATVYSGSRAISEIPMSFNWVYGLWTGTFSILPSDPTGFYKVSVSGNDGAGNSGSFSTVIRVAPYHLSGQVILPSTSISMNGGSEPTVSAKLTYPNGTLMKSGSVEAFVSHVMDGTFVPIDHTRLSYQASTESFVGPNVLPPASILNTAPGEYLVSVQAFDASGNYGNLTSTFFVNANQRGAISISSNSQFTSANGVVGGTGTSSDPYLIAGWNTSSISISSNVSASYELLNDWVHGSGGNGIVINTPASTSSSIDNVYSISNHGNGLVVSNSTGVSIVRVDASNNSQDGILLSGVNQGNVQQSVAANNGGDGVVLESAPFFSILSTSATNNRNYGFYLFGSRNSTLFGDNATSNSVGVYVTGSSGHGYGGSEILGGYFVGNNIGIDVNGLHQNVSDNSSSLSSVSIDQTIQLENNIGTFAANDSVLGLEASVIGYNTWGVVVQNSLPLVVNNVISQNAAVGLNVTGSFSGTGHCIITFTNQTTFDYNSCIAINYLTLNGAAGLEMTNLNGSFIYQDAAVGNAANGFDLGNLRDSLVSTLISILNQGDGISLSGATGSEIVSNQIGGNLNGMLAKSSFGDAFDQNNASLNAFDGLVFSGSQNNTISNNTAIEDALFCSSSIGCTVAAGIELSNSSSNLLTLNQVTNITARAGSGAGIYIEAGSSNNTVRLNNSTLNFAGISIVDSSYNSIDNNTLVSDTYGIFLSNAPNNALSVNTYHGLEQYLYPNEPSVSFSNIVNGSSYSGKVVISWIATGQAISLQKLIIDGNPQNVTGSSFTLNSSNLSDGNHSLTITVTNSGGLSASASVVISTRNHEVLSVRALGPNGIVLPGITVNLTGSSTILNATTNSVGNALFSGLPAGSYLASALVNGSLVSAQVSFITNETVTLYVPRLITTVVATTSSGSTTSLTLDGNITSSNLSAVVLQNSNGVYNISFGISGITGALGRATLAIPKSAVPGGLVPEILLNGNPASNQSFSQTKDDYYVTFSASASAPGNVSIQFVHLVGFDPRLVVLAVIIVALLAGAIIVAYSRRRSPLNRALLGV